MFQLHMHSDPGHSVVVVDVVVDVVVVVVVVVDNGNNLDHLESHIAY